MLLEIGIALAVGVIFGWVIAWAISQSSREQQKRESDQLAAELTQRASALEAAQRDQSALNARVLSLETDKARLMAEKNAEAQNAERSANAVEELRGENARVRNDLSAAQTDLATLRTTLEAEQKSAQEKLDLLTSARDELSNQFKAVAGDILKENSKAFTEQNQANIGQLLNPLKEKFDEFRTEVKNLNESGITGRTQLKEQIDNLAKLNTRLSDDANNLTTALKGSSKVQGDWGELVLERILEASGLRKGQEYRVQESFTREERSDDGRLRARPDVIVDLPEDRHIVIDSKVSLNAYNDYCATQDDQMREAAQTRHLASVRNHFRDLSKRDYRSLYQLNSLDFVVMFVPIEPAFTLALASDDKLWEEAWNKNVLLVSRTSLLFVLRTVAHLWRQEQQTRNVQEIVNRGAELYDKLAAFAADLTEVGKNLDKAHSSYDEAVKKLSTGKGNAIRQAEMLKGLGIKPSRAIPIALLDQAAENEEPLELAASGTEDGMEPA